MKAPAVEYVRPASLEEAVGILALRSGEAQLLAGGQSLLAMMNLRLAAPDLLIDISRLPELAAVGEDADAVTLGAGVTHAMIEDRRLPDPSQGLLPRAAETLAYRAVRTRGTVGGSLALADPAGEWPCVFAAISAVAASARWGYVKLARKTGAFAMALAVVVADREQGHCRAVLGAMGGPPLVLEETSSLLGAGGRDMEPYRRTVATDLAAASGRHFDAYEARLHAATALRAIGQVLA
jgi:carbon-monoxide dehydrogenase medium subunit